MKFAVMKLHKARIPCTIKLKNSTYLKIKITTVLIQMTSVLVMTRWSGDKKANITGTGHKNLLSLSFGLDIHAIDLNNLITKPKAAILGC